MKIDCRIHQLVAVAGLEVRRAHLKINPNLSVNLHKITEYLVLYAGYYMNKIKIVLFLKFVLNLFFLIFQIRLKSQACEGCEKSK